MNSREEKLKNLIIPETSYMVGCWENQNLNLDVGCGKAPRGDVNVDLFLNQWTGHLTGYIDAKLIPNPIKADAHCLPFPDRIFETVFAYALLEHVKDATQVLKELLRVAWRAVKILVPHRYNRRGFFKGQTRFHLRSFSYLQTVKWIQNNGYYPLMDTHYKDYPHRLLPWFRLPDAIIISVNVGGEKNSEV